jgi:hypothetical protein
VPIVTAGPLGLLHLPDDVAQLQPDEGEDDGLQQQVQRGSQRPFLQPGGVAGLRPAVPQVEAGRDDREHPGAVQLLGEQVGGERHDQPEHRLGHRVAQPHPHGVHHPAEHQSDPHAGHDGQAERACGAAPVDAEQAAGGAEHPGQRPLAEGGTGSIVGGRQAVSSADPVDGY